MNNINKLRETKSVSNVSIPGLKVGSWNASDKLILDSIITTTKNLEKAKQVFKELDKIENNPVIAKILPVLQQSEHKLIRLTDEKENLLPYVVYFGKDYDKKSMKSRKDIEKDINERDFSDLASKIKDAESQSVDLNAVIRSYLLKVIPNWETTRPGTTKFTVDDPDSINADAEKTPLQHMQSATNLATLKKLMTGLVNEELEFNNILNDIASRVIKLYYTIENIVNIVKEMKSEDEYQDMQMVAESKKLSLKSIVEHYLKK